MLTIVAPALVSATRILPFGEIASSPVPVTPRGSRIDLPVRNLVMFSSLGMEKLPHEGYTWRRQAFGSLGDGAPWRQTADEPRLRLAGHLGLCGILKAP